MLIFHKIISWVFNPIFVVLVGLSAVLIYSFDDLTHRILWFGILFLTSFIPTCVYYLKLLLQHRIDADIKNIKWRKSIFKVSALGTFSAAFIALFLSNAPILVRILFAGAVFNLLCIVIISILSFEISVHLGVLTVVAMFFMTYISWRYIFVWTPVLFLTAWSRYTLKMHTVPELIIGFLSSGFIYLMILSLY